MSSRKKRSPEEQARREKIRELLQSSGVSSMEDIQDLFKETIAEFMENGLDAELDEELGYSKYDYRNKNTDNSRNGHSSKTLRTSFGDVEVSVPRDRKGEFEPRILKKNQTSISQDIEEKILSMYAKGMTTSDIEAHIRDIYGIEVSDTTVSRVTDKILPIVKEWQQRPLEAVYAVVYLDAIHYHVRSEGQIIKKAVYIAIGIDLEGRKDVLGMWVGENESAKFWATGVYPEFCVKSELRHKIERKYMVREGGLSGLPCPQYKRKAECMSRAAAPDAVHFTLDMQAVFCYSGIRSPKKIAIWA